MPSTMTTTRLNKASFMKVIIRCLALMVIFNLFTMNIAKAEESGNSTAEGAPTQMERGGTNTLTGNHSYSDLYASFLFSRANGDTASQDKTTLSELAKYPSIDSDVSEDGSKKDGNAYGDIPTPVEGASQKDVGKQAATYLNTLYQYEYFVPASNSEEGGVLGTVKSLYNSVTNSGGGGSGFLMKMALDTTSFGATAYDFFMKAINTLSDIIGSIDVSVLFTGFGSDGEGFISKWMSNIFSFLGLSPEVIKAIKNVFFIFILFMLSLSLIKAFKGKEIKKDTKLSFKRHGTRVIVALSTVVIGIVTTDITNTIADGSKDLQKNQSLKFTESYVLDTLLFAATTNLNIGIANPSHDIKANKDGKPDDNFKPTTDAVERIMNDVNKRALYSGIESKKLSANDLLGNLTEQSAVSVDDYIAYAAKGAKTKGVTAVGSTSTYDDTHSGYTTGEAFEKESYVIIDDKFSAEKKLSRNPVFLSPNPNFKDVFSEVLSKEKGTEAEGLKGKNIYYISPYEKVKDDDKKEKKSLRQQASDKIGYSLTYKQVTNSPIPQAQNSRYKLTNVTPDSPDTYIYGAVAPAKATQAHKQYSNYINAPSGMQGNDPVTGSSEIEDSKLKDSMNTNALRIALMNRNGGISSPQGVKMKSLSTQSVAFLIQTGNPKNGVLNYKGFNAISSKEGESKQTGKNGTGFVRYTIPNSGKTDLLSKIGALNFTWLNAGILSAAAFFYLITTPVLGALWKQTYGFAQGFFRGNFAGVGRYVLYKLAIRLSFTFTTIAVIACMLFSTMLLNKFHFLGAFIGVSEMMGKFAQGAIMLMAIIMSLVFLIPIAKVPQKNGKVKRVGLLALGSNFWYLVSEILEEKLDDLYYKVYGHGIIDTAVKSGKLTSMGYRKKLGKGKDFAKKATVYAGSQAAIAAVTGGSSLLTQGSGVAAKLAMSQGTGKLAGSLENVGKGLMLNGSNYGIGRDGGFDVRLGELLTNYSGKLREKGEKANDIEEGNKLLKNDYGVDALNPKGYMDLPYYINSKDDFAKESYNEGNSNDSNSNQTDKNVSNQAQGNSNDSDKKGKSDSNNIKGASESAPSNSLQDSNNVVHTHSNSEVINEVDGKTEIKESASDINQGSNNNVQGDKFNPEEMLLSSQFKDALNSVGKSNISGEIRDALVDNAKFVNAVGYRENAKERINIDTSTLNELRQQQVNTNDVNVSNDLSKEINRLENSIRNESKKLVASENMIREAISSEVNNKRVERIKEASHKVEKIWTNKGDGELNQSSSLLTNKEKKENAYMSRETLKQLKKLNDNLKNDKDI
ncbi:hypothetical protein MTQ93_09590 [Staphylococcus agnetis]|uniref:hypothetical protein n=1 Tax=Staphylococcus agnetis TaxID=985762 RepID=UPI00208F3D93|nr:hypothetical protein [Staphylococcus agnetis]MCO4346296.1 hypothetical protein [Staphylococcus agnetis]MCO4360628.1 hypothetical protein [Staphylococcus agnetis]